MAKFTPRPRKHKQRQRDGQSSSKEVADTNVTELQPVSTSEKEERRQKLKQELQSQQPKMSAKKKKRLDKYIENKLKKDESLELLKKLAQAKIDTSTFQSSKNLARRKRDVQRNPVARRHEATSEIVSDDDSDDLGGKFQLQPAFRTTLIDAKPAVLTQATPAIGSGLKRPLELGTDGFPVLKTRKRRRKAATLQEPVWEGFGSDDEETKAPDQGNFRADDIQSRDSEDEHSAGRNSSQDEGSALNEGGDVTDDDDEGGGGGEEEDDDGNDMDNTSNEESEERDDDEKSNRIRPRNSAFKAWAKQQINEAVGFKPTADQPISIPSASDDTLIPPRKKEVKNSIYEEEPLPLELQTTKGDPNRKAFSIQVDRREEIQDARLKLPVVGEEQKIMEAIYNNPSVVIWGATGSGKTTQLPQFLFEAGYGSPESSNPGIIGVTQPRRVAAVSMANRVAEELGQFSDRVSYQIRFDTTVSSKTAIKFMTDGILIREIAKDFSLSKYSIIIIDEAHERSVNTDILIGMVSRIIDLRKSMSEEDPTVKPLKLVIMSATLRISDFTQNPHLFRHGPPPLVQAEGRQYPVTIHFARKTHRDYVEEAYRKVSRGHHKLPPGGILVFLTGQDEIKQLSKRLKQAFKPTQQGETISGKVQVSAVDAPLEAEDLDLGGTGESKMPVDDSEDSDLEITGLDEQDGDDEEFDVGEESMSSSTRVHVLPLYSQLPTKEQMRIFEPPPDGSRLIVLATNVAETSLTIPGIRYVFDCGRSKEKQYDIRTGVQKFEIGWISKASASQRAGRAGRTGPGHCYRLYSSAIYESDFVEHTDPEILRTPIEGVVLQMKSMGLHHVANFPFPTPPSREGLARAEMLLKNLAALTPEGKVTDIGHRLSTYPLSPRFGKMLQIGHQHGCMPYVIALVSALALGDLFIPESQIDMKAPNPDANLTEVYTNADRLEDTARDERRKGYGRAHQLLSKHSDTSDALKYLSAICAYAYATDPETFCSQMFLRFKPLKEASQLRQQLTEIVRANNPGIIGRYEACLPEPSEKQLKALKQIVTAGFIDNVAIRADLAPVPPEIVHKPRRAIEVPYLTLFRSREGRTTELDEKAVYVHPSSVIARLSPKEMPQYIVFSHLQQSSASSVSDSAAAKIRMFPLVAPSGLQLSALAHGTPLIEYGKPIGKVESLGGNPERRQCWVVPSLVGTAGSTGWPLPAKKVVQIKDKKQGWLIEKFVT